MGRVPYILSELSNLSAISEPLRNSSRIKYTCFNVSQNYLVFGASSGGLYVFRRDPCSFIQLLPSTEGAVTLLSISPCESLVAFSTARGSLSIVGLRSKVGTRFKRILNECENSTITAVQWSARATEVYIGDSSGRVSVINLLFYMLSHSPLMQLDSRVVQMDWHCHLLLVSTLSRSYLCDTKHEQYRQIGTQLRDGFYGACFHNIDEEEFQVSWDVAKENARYMTSFSSLREGERLLSDERLRNVRVYCARPGLRLWEVLIDGSVLNTHQLKKAVDIPSTSVLYIEDVVEEVTPARSETDPPPFNFSKLYRAIGNRFLLAFHSDGFYLLDPVAGNVVARSNSFSGIIDVKTVNNMIYLWCSDGRMHGVTVSALDSLLGRLYLQTKYIACAELVAHHEQQLAAMVTESPRLLFLPEMAKKIREKEIIVTDGASDVIESLAQIVVSNNQERQKALKLDSGIFLVGNEFSLRQYNSQPKIQVSSCKDSLSESQKGCEANFHDGSIHSKNGFGNDGNFLKIDDDLRSTSSRDSSDFENTDDLDDAFQLLGITKQEMKFALKEMGNTITDTFSSSTKSVKKSLHLLIKKQKHAWAAGNGFNSFSPAFGEDSDTNSPGRTRRKSLVEWKETPNVGINNFLEACEALSNYNSTGGRSLQEYVFSFLEAMVSLCERYSSLSSDDTNDVTMGRRSEPVYEEKKLSDVFSEWLRKEENTIFSYHQIFDGDLLTQIRTHLHGSLKSGTLVTWIRKNLPDIVGNKNLYPAFMRNIYNEDEFHIDQILSQLLKINASLLDPFIILQCLTACGSPCIYLSWNEVMELCQHGKLHKDMSTLEEVQRHEWPLPVTLNAVLIMLDLKQMEYCKAVPVKDIVYIINRLESKEIKNEKSAVEVFEKCGTLFMNYLDALLPQEINQALDDMEIRMFVFSLFEHLECFKHKFQCCPCGFPQHFISEELNQHRLPYKNVCKSLILWSKCNDKEKLDEMCHLNPLFWPLVLSTRRTDPLESLLPIIIQMGDFLALEHRLTEVTDELWAKAFRLCHALGENSCLNCSKPFTSPLNQPDEIGKPDRTKLLWQRFIELILRKTGPVTAAKLLGDHVDMIPHGTVDVRFLKLFAISALLDPTSGRLSRHVVDTLTNSPRKIPNVPVFSQSLVENFEERGPSTDFLPLVTKKESSTHHWGVKINLQEAVCPFCLLSLGSSVLVEKGGLTIFRCTHGFHTICLQRRCPTPKSHSCPLCQSNTTKLDKE